MSDDLIRRQDAIDAIGNLSDEMYRAVEKGATFPTKAWFDGMAQAEHIVKNLPSAQPTIDAVEVVRCKDCKHSKDGVGGRIKCDYHNWWQEPDFFCADAERRDDGQIQQSN